VPSGHVAEFRRGTQLEKATSDHWKWPFGITTQTSRMERFGLLVTLQL